MSKATTVEIINHQWQDCKISFQPYTVINHLDMMASLYKTPSSLKVTTEVNKQFCSHEELFDVIAKYLSENNYPHADSLIEYIDTLKEELLPKNLSNIIDNNISKISLEKINSIKEYLEKITKMILSLLPPQFIETHAITDIIPALFVNRVLNKMFELFSETPSKFSLYFSLFDKLRGYLYSELLESSTSSITNMHTQKEFFFNLFRTANKNFSRDFNQGKCFAHESLDQVNEQRKIPYPDDMTEYRFFSMDDAEFLPPEKGEEQKKRNENVKSDQLEDIKKFNVLFEKRGASSHLSSLGDTSQMTLCFQNDSFGFITLFFQYFLQKYSKVVPKSDEQLFSVCNNFYDFGGENKQTKEWIAQNIFRKIDEKKLDLFLLDSLLIDSYVIPYSILTTCKPLRAKVINNFALFASLYKSILFTSFPDKRNVYFNVNIGNTGPLVIRKMPIQIVNDLEEFIIAYNKTVIGDNAFSPYCSEFDKLNSETLIEINKILQFYIPHSEKVTRMEQLKKRISEEENYSILVSFNDKYFSSQIGEAELYPMCNQLTIKNRHNDLKMREYILNDLANIKKNLFFDKKKCIEAIENDEHYALDTYYTINPNDLTELVVNIDTDVIFYHLLNFRLSHMEEDKFTGNVYIKMGEYPSNNITKFHTKEERNSNSSMSGKIRGVFDFKKLFEKVGETLMKTENDRNPFVSYNFPQETFSIVMMMGGTDYIKYRIAGIGHKTLFDTLLEYYPLIGDIGEIKYKNETGDKAIEFFIYNKIHAIYSIIFFCKKNKINPKHKILEIQSSVKKEMQVILKEINNKEKQLICEIENETELDENEKLIHFEKVSEKMAISKFNTIHSYYIGKIAEGLTKMINHIENIETLSDIVDNQGKVLQWVVDYFSNALVGLPHPVRNGFLDPSYYGFKMEDPQKGWIHGNVVNSLHKRDLKINLKRKPQQSSTKKSSNKKMSDTKIMECFEEENKKEVIRSNSNKRQLESESKSKAKKTVTTNKKPKKDKKNKEEDIDDFIKSLEKSKKKKK